MKKHKENNQQSLVGAWFPKPVAEELQRLAKQNERSRGGELRMAVQHWLTLHPTTDLPNKEVNYDSQK